jgi:hypothetical protein
MITSEPREIQSSRFLAAPARPAQSSTATPYVPTSLALWTTRYFTVPTPVSRTLVLEQANWNQVRCVRRAAMAACDEHRRRVIISG